MTEPEVLEQGSPRRRASRWLVLAAAVVVLAVGVFGARLLAEESTAPTGPLISSVEWVDAASVDPNAEGSGWPIKVGMPSEATLPGARLMLTVEADPRRSIEVVTSPSGGALSIQPVEPVVIDAGTPTELAVVIAPLDCAVTDTSLDEAGYRWRRATGVQLLEELGGPVLPLSDSARAQIAEVLSRLCAAAPEAPRLTMVDAMIDGPWRDQVLDITAEVEATADRVLLHPLDGPGLRGIGSFQRPGSPSVTLMWAVAPLGEDSDGVLDALVRVIAVKDGIAYPWIARISPPSPLSELTPLRTEPDGG